MTKLARMLVAVLAALALAAVGVATAAKSKHKGKADSGTVWAAFTYSKNGIQYAAGNASDKLFGKTAVTYALKITPATPGTITVTAKPVTTWAKGGSLRGTATATVTLDSAGNETISNGKLKETKGTGVFKGHTFTATFTGTGNAKTGQFVFNYKGRYK